jgi:AP2 domain
MSVLLRKLKRVRLDASSGSEDDEPMQAGPSQKNPAGVTWSESCEAWVSRWAESGVSCQVSFSVAAFGDDEALRLAIEAKRRFQAAIFPAAEVSELADDLNTQPETIHEQEAGQPREPAKRSGVTGVSWNRGMNCWHAQWYEGGKKRYKLFPVSKFGEAEALRLAIECRQEKEKSGKAGLMPVAVRQSGHVGVSWDEVAQGWRAHVSRNGKQIQKHFPFKTYGEAEALRLAIAWRQENKNP